MSFIKYARKPYLPIFLALLIIFTSCNGNEFVQDNQSELNSEQSKFDFSFFENNQSNLINIKSFNFDKKSSLSRLEINNMILNEINMQLGTELDFSTRFKEVELNSLESITNWIYENGVMDEVDMQILNNFSMNLGTIELSRAISILENDTNNANLTTFKTEKFQYLANVIRLIENETPGFFTSQQKGCIGATLGLAFASAALVLACNPPALGATVGAGCYLAGANFVRASITLGIECGD